ncbi:putative glycoside hydrolase [Streptomyces sp. NBC_00669]|uniref:putative glycoside hydrolase n=1 Tax=Streptomyces sp. NBC_00669 TaxID=2976011 RepID=UPI002E377FAE|nr:putative glycoside hydrolase [Streptomyces sp. NBC_00669]
MTRRTFLAGSTLAAAAAAMAFEPPGTASAAAAAGPVLPDPPGSGIARAQIFDNQIPDRTVYAGLTYFVWGASSLAQPAGAVPCGYLPAFRDYDRGHDLAWYQANHPDWVVYQADQATPAYEFGNTTYLPIDFTNPAVRTYYYDTYVQPLIDAGYPLVGFDNVVTFNGYGSCGHFDATGAWVQQYSGARVDDVWAAAVLDWLDHLAGRLHAAGAGIAANITWNASVKTADMLQAVGLVDVYVDEQGFTAHRVENYNDQAWQDRFDFVRQVAPSTAYVSINQTATADLADASTAQVDWVIANYLLYREQRSMLALCGDQQYHVFLDRPELHTDIGAPAAAPYADAGGARARSYTGGLALVNPSSTQATTTALPAGTWTDLRGTAHTGQIVLQPNSGTVLAGPS